MSEVSFTPTETCGKFMVSDAQVRALIGPVGSSKTTTCLYEVVRRACEQRPADDGVRYTRFAFVRNTLKSLKETVLKDFQQLFGEVIHYKVSESTIYIQHDDIDCEILLMPLEYPEDQKRLLSSQLTGIYFNEFSEVDPDFISPALGRCGRYPSQKRGFPSWHGVIMDSNPGTMDSPWYPKLHENLPANWAYFQQPAPLLYGKEEDEYTPNPDAENIENLPPNPKNKATGKPISWDYYFNLMEGATPAWVDRYVMGNWGRSLEGVPVFDHRFNIDMHVSKAPLILSQTHPIIIGMDFARVPAAIFGQVNHEGRLLIKKEMYMEKGLELFIDTMVIPALQEEWAVGRPVFIVGDPSGIVRDRHEVSDFGFLHKRGFEAVKASTNLIQPRLAAVDSWLLKMWAGGAALQIDEEGCPMLIDALEDRYRYKKKRDGTVADKPDKDARPWADLADALQYLCLGTDERLIGKVMRRLGPPREVAPPPPVGAWT